MFSERIEASSESKLNLSLIMTFVQQEHATETEETCTQYNMLKIARYLFRWTGAPVFADYYERALLNGLIGTQRMPAGYSPQASASWKGPLNGSSAPENWCGTGPTSHACVLQSVLGGCCVLV